MKLEEIDIKTDLVNKALNDGIETVEQYEVWLIGYTTAIRDIREEIKRDRDELQNMQYTNK